MKTTTALFLSALMAAPLMAQDKLFTLDDLVFGGSTYFTRSYPASKFFTWWGETCVEQDMEECRLVSGKTLLTLEQLNKALGEAGRKILRHCLDVTFPYTDQTLALCTVGRERTLVDWEAGKAVWHTDIEAEDGTEDWNAKSRATAFVQNDNLMVINASGETLAVSHDGSPDLRYGTSVHRDEFGISKGTFWSPDGQRLAFYKMDQSMVSHYPQVNVLTDSSPLFTRATGSATADTPAASRCATPAPDPYPMAGETSHKVWVGVFDIQTRQTVYLQTGDPTDRYFTNIAWAPDGKSLYLIELNRAQTHGSLDQYDTATGKKLRTLFTEFDEKYFEPMNPIQFLPWDSSRFIYQTRRDGYNHIYLYRTDGTLERQLTTGEFEVISVLGFNEARKTVIYTSNEAHLLHHNSYSVDMKGRRTLLDDGNGWHTPSLSLRGTQLLTDCSSPEVARRIDLIDTGRAQAATLFTAPDPWDGYKKPDIKVGTIKADDGVTDLYYRLILPPDFDPSRKYPAVVYVYGGPHFHMIDASRNWGVRGWDIWMAQRGYVMFCLDNRGSDHRGLAFEQASFHQMGVEEMRDQLRGVDFLISLPYVDGDRLGVHGWSYGGYMATSLMTTYPGVFKVGVAGGPVIDWRFYEVMYGERYMGTPTTNPDGYERTSLLRKAGDLKGRLLIVYGGNDPVCVPQHTLSFVRACIDAGTYPDLFVYPGSEHNMIGSEQVHLHNLITRYFDEHL